MLIQTFLNQTSHLPDSTLILFSHSKDFSKDMPLTDHLIFDHGTFYPDFNYPTHHQLSLGEFRTASAPLDTTQRLSMDVEDGFVFSNLTEIVIHNNTIHICVD